MNELNAEQLKRLSEISGNIAVAWFTAGIISPLFTVSKTPLEIFIGIVVGLTMTTFFASVSLRVLKELSYD